MISLPVTELSQVGAARRKALHAAEMLGLSVDDRERLALVITEAGTNLVRHARGGEILLILRGAGDATAVDVIAVDEGPGIADVEAAMADGYTTAEPGDRGIGGGLGAIVRLSDSFDIHTDPRGTTVAITIGAIGQGRDAALETAGLIVPKPGFDQGGDAFGSRCGTNTTLIMLMDVLGHGPAAASEAEKAVAAFAELEAASLEEMEGSIAEALRGGRGAAALLVELPHEAGKLRAMGLGNVRGEIMAPDAKHYGIPSTPGIVGSTAKAPRVTEHDWPNGALLILSTDGLRGGERAPEPSSLFFRDPMTIAATIYKRRRRGTDDCGVVVARARS
ncbi:MAG TPA: ATP-binding protein [Aurantimonas sp.]